jgi:PPK2 family polyphosphate:nucleotide phosphotransferase
MAKLDNLVKNFMVKPGSQISLKDYSPGHTGDFINKAEAMALLQQGIQLLAEYQDKLYAQDTYALLIILQAMDAAGKDGVIKHVMGGLNPQGTQVYSFKVPSPEELDHDYLWRHAKALPERGRIGIFNRSYYEEVLVVRVHPQFLENQHLPPVARRESVWKRRYKEMNSFEQYLVENGIIVLKFFLNLSKEEQKKRFLERIERPEKNWKFSSFDTKERAYWEDYQSAYEDALNATSTRWAPWHIIPADHKWFTRLAVAQIIIEKLRELNPVYPKVSDAQQQELIKAREMLESEA